MAAGLASSGAEIVILEASDHLPDRVENRDARAIFQRSFFRPQENWYERDAKGNIHAFNPGNYYNVGGNSKFYGAVLTRFRTQDFEERRHYGGLSPAWPFTYDELEPWYGKAEHLYQVRGTLGEDPTEPPHSQSYNYPAIEDEASMAQVRARLRKMNLNPYSLPLGIDIKRWLVKGQTPWDGYPNVDDGKMDAETAALKPALHHDNVRLITRAPVFYLETDGAGKKIIKVHYRHQGEKKTICGRIIILAAGAVRSSALLLQSADEKNPQGLANRCDQVGRNFMNHNASAVIAFNPLWKNTAVYQKTFGMNDFYFGDETTSSLPLGNVQLLGRVGAPILKANMPYFPERLLTGFANHTIDFYAMSEDLPIPESRVMVEGEKIYLHWARTNWQAHVKLVKKLKSVLHQAGFPVVVSKVFDRRTPSHQCGTVRIGVNPMLAPLDIWSRAWDHPNLYVVDASFLPTSAAVNPALTIAAQALRVANYIIREELA